MKLAPLGLIVVGSMEARAPSKEHAHFPGGDNGIFRPDYPRDALDVPLSTHLHVRGSLMESCLPAACTRERVHFPTDRMALEAVLRLLVESWQFRRINLQRFGGHSLQRQSEHF